MDEFLKGIELMPPFTVIFRLSAATLAGFFIGLEREKQNQPAGLRTHMVLALGACLIMVLSLYIPLAFSKQYTMSDPARLAAQVISGIGFLGAGAIFRYGFNIKGLTTAAAIWTTSGIGLAFGAGFYFLGTLSTILLIIILYVFDRIEDFLFEQRKMRVLTVIFNAEKLKPKAVIDIVKKYDIRPKQPSITENVEQQTTEVVINCKIDDDFSIRELFEDIKSLGDMKTIRID